MKNTCSSDNKLSWFGFPIIALLAIIVYLPTFTGDFILDDRSLIEKNPYIKEMHSIGSYLSQEDGITDEEDLGIHHTGYYRPLINITYWIDYKIWGMKACGFRATNFILHLFGCLALFKLLLLLIADNRWAVFWVVAVFALHPVNTESVSWVVSRNNIIVTLFILLSLYFYITAWIENNHFSLTVSVFFFLCAVLSKEFAVMLLPVFFLCHRFVFEGERKFLRELTGYIPFVLMVVFYFILRYRVTGAVLTPSGMNDTWQRVYFVPYLIACNLKLIFLPLNLHNFNLTYPGDWFGWRALSSIALFLLICVSMWRGRKHSLLLFSGLSSLLFMFPVLNVIPTAAISLIAMRWMYLPMAFIAIGAVLVVKWGINRRRAFTITMLCVVLSYLGAYSFILNKYLWHDENTFFATEVKQFGNEQLYAGELAEVLFKRGRYRVAEKFFLIAIKSRPREARNYINYSALLTDTGRYSLALSYLEEAKEFIKTVKDRKELLNNMGVALAHDGKTAEAADSLMRAIELDPEYAEAHNNYGVVLMNQGRIKDAISSFREALKLSRDYTSADNNLKIALSMQGKKEPGENDRKRLEQ